MKSIVLWFVLSCVLLATVLGGLIPSTMMSDAQAAGIAVVPGYDTFQVESESRMCYTFVRFNTTGQLFYLAAESCWP